MVKFGVIGAGKIAKSFCDACKGINENLYAIASRDLDKAKQFQAKYGFEVTYDSYESLCLDPNVTCVYIATPHALHYEHMKLALSNGKHILCEKSFTLNHHQAEEILKLAKEKNRFVMEAMWTRFLPVIQEVKKTIDRGEIGEIIQIDATFGFDAGGNYQSRVLDINMGGGALLDIGIYPITISNYFLGIPDSVESVVEMDSTGVDISEKITYFYPKAEANLKMSLKENLGVDAYLYGTKGYIHIPHFNSADFATIFNNNHKVIREIEHKHIVNGLEYEIFETIRCIKKKQLESMIMPHETTIEILRQMDVLRKEWNLKYPLE